MGKGSKDLAEVYRGRTRITAKIYHKPIIWLSRPIEAVAIEARSGVRNAGKRR